MAKTEVRKQGGRRSHKGLFSEKYRMLAFFKERRDRSKNIRTYITGLSIFFLVRHHVVNTEISLVLVNINAGY